MQNIMKNRNRSPRTMYYAATISILLLFAILQNLELLKLLPAASDRDTPNQDNALKFSAKENEQGYNNQTTSDEADLVTNSTKFESFVNENSSALLQLLTAAPDQDTPNQDNEMNISAKENEQGYNNQTTSDEADLVTNSTMFTSFVDENSSALSKDVNVNKSNQHHYHPVQTLTREIISNSSYSLPRPPWTMGAFIHLGKTGGSTLSRMLRNGCHSFVPKPCAGKPTIDYNIISKTTTYYHTPDLPRGLSKRDGQSPYKFFVIPVRDPLSRAISAFLYNHPNNRAVEGLNDAREKKNYIYRRIVKHSSNNDTKALEYIKTHPELKYVYDIELDLYLPCFPTLEEYAKNLANFTDDYEWKIWSSFTGNTTDCASLAKSTLRHAAFDAMTHNHYDLRLILSNLKNANDRPFLVIRNEFIEEDWKSAHLWLGDEGELSLGKTMRNSTAVDYPVKKIISNEGVKNLCLALKDEYRVYLRMLVLAKNLSEESVEKSLGIARTNCPWLDLTKPDVNVPEKFVTEEDKRAWEF